MEKILIAGPSFYSETYLMMEKRKQVSNRNLCNITG